MAETQLQIPVVGTPVSIHCRLRARNISGRNIVFVFAHGLGGQMNDSLFVNCARELERLGHSSLRFNAYGEAGNERRFADYTIRTQAGDLDTVTALLKDRHPGLSEPPLVIAVGHCMGAYALFSSRERRFDAAVVVSHGELALGRTLGAFDPGLDSSRVVEWDLPYLVSAELIRQYQSFDVISHCRNFTKPLFGVNGRDVVDREQGRLQIRAAATPHKDSFEVDGADHWFSTETAVDSLVDILDQVARRVLITDRIDDRLDRGPIEQYVDDLLEFTARHCELSRNFEQAMGEMHGLLADVSARRMIAMSRAAARSEVVSFSALGEASERRRLLREALRKKLRSLYEMSVHVEVDSLTRLWREDVLGENGIARTACEIAVLDSRIDRTISNTAPSSDVRLMGELVHATSGLGSTEYKSILAHAGHDVSGAARRLLSSQRGTLDLRLLMDMRRRPR